MKRRADDPERMDSGAVSPAEFDDALDFLSAANTFLGGWSVMRERLEAWSRRWGKGEIITMLYVGTGAADIPLRILDWGRRRGFNIEIIGIDTDAKVLELARARTAGEESLGLMHMDLGAFAALGGRFDYVLGSLFLHHLPPAELEDSLSPLLARHGVCVDELSPLILHPGSARILDACERAMGLPDGAAALSRPFLRRHGNRSSASVLFILKDALAQLKSASPWGLLAALGPGFACEALLIRNE